MIEPYKKECDIIEELCIYNAETHTVIAKKTQNKTFWVQMFPAFLSSLSALLVVGQVIPSWWGWITLSSSIIVAVGSTLDTKTTFFNHLFAAKHFTALRHEVRSFRDTFSAHMSEAEIMNKTREFGIKYEDLIRFTPLTDNKSFAEARARIKCGVHIPDVN